MKKIYFSILFVIISIISFAQIPTNGLVAYYPFNGNAVDIVNNNNGNLQNGTTFTLSKNGQSNGAALFDGIDDWISTPMRQKNLQGYSISVWLKSTDNSFVVLQNRGAEFSGGKSLTLSYGDGRFGFAVDGDFIWVGKRFSFSLQNTWIHLVGTWTSNNASSFAPSQFNLFLNGQKVNAESQSVGSSTIPNAPNGFLKIGRHDAWNNYFGGAIDDLRIYNRALTDSEVQTIYQNECPTIDCNTALTDVSVLNLSEPINNASYTVPREAIVHHYFLVKKTSNGQPIKNVVLKYTIGTDPTIRTSLPSGDDGLIDLNITVGGANPNNQTDDWIPKTNIFDLNTFYPVQFHSLAVGTITGTNAFTPFQLKVIDKAQPDEKEYGFAFSLGAGSGLEFGKDVKIGNLKLKAGIASLKGGKTSGPHITINPISQDLWRIRLGADKGLLV